MLIKESSSRHVCAVERELCELVTQLLVCRCNLAAPFQLLFCKLKHLAGLMGKNPFVANLMASKLLSLLIRKH